MRKTKIRKEEIINLYNSPFLKKLLINYCLIQYEQDTLLDDEYLLREYYYLKKIDAIEELFNCERLTIMYSENQTIKKSNDKLESYLITIPVTLVFRVTFEIKIYGISDMSKNYFLKF